MVPAILQIRMLAPGEVLESQEQWDQRTNSREPVSPGRYTVEGALLTSTRHPLKTPTALLQILPRNAKLF